MDLKENYNVFAIKYATRKGKSSDHFFNKDDIHENTSMPMDYYIWLILSENNAIVVDTGFTEEVAIKRGRVFLQSPIDILAKLGVDSTKVSTVILTHMHYDHIGTLNRFPNATFVLQDSEMAFWTGRYASKKNFKNIIEENDVVHLVKENFKGRIHFVNGSEEIMPGVHVHKAGGHSIGLQVVTVETKKGRVVLASDVTHFYRNIAEDRPFSIVHDLADMYEAFNLVRSLGNNPELIIPGHDPKVMDLFPAVNEELKGIAVKIV